MPWTSNQHTTPGNWKTLKAKILRDHAGVCHICGHQGAEQVDHIISIKAWQRQQLAGSPHHPSNLAPAHQQPCRVCQHTCHADKTQQEARAGQAHTSRRRQTEQHPGAIH